MLPLRDTIRSYSFPIVNLSLIGLNALVFLFEISLSSRGLDSFIYNFGLVPVRLNLTQPLQALSDPSPWLTLVTHMFLHGGWVHFLSNAWILFIFGDNVEDRMGHGRYLVFYLLSGLASGLLQALVSPSSQVPAIGASGAIAGVLGAYFVLFPGARVVTLIPIFLFPWFVEIPALFYLGFWFVSQLFSGLAALQMPEAVSMGGIAWWAHIGGFIFGILFYRLFTPRIHPAYSRRFPQFPSEF
ncbi:MAG TPA: rhomboid family intramembrane serine protease [Anaerolineales bacterium]|nr:rhomboid family intramembrane serine protease [Anaerolineales bacterium]